MGRLAEVNRLRPPNRKVTLWRGLLLVWIVAVALGLVTMAAASAMYRKSIQTRINSIGLALDADRIVRLRDAATDNAAQSDNTYVKNKLAAIKAVNSDVQFVYLMARDADKGVYFLADSEQPGTSGYSPRGQSYPEASPGLKAMFSNGHSFVEEPSQDSYGSWLSALAPVKDGQSKQLVAVVGIDVPANFYIGLLAVAGGIPLLIALVVSLLMYVRYANNRRHVEDFQFRAEMISIASHELRTPLTGLRWSQENLINKKLPPDKQQHAMEIMYDSTRRLQDSIEDILQLANLESGHTQRLFFQQADLRSMLDDILATQSLAAQRSKVTLSYADDWPKTLPIECDVNRLKRVFSNLISNAVKYSRSGSEVMIGYSRSKKGDHLITIQDSGIGIPKEEQETVWAGYYRASNAAAHNVTGNGIGLYLVRTIVEQHGGRSWFESDENKGTTFFVELPDKHDDKDKPAGPPVQTPPKSKPLDQ